MPARSVEAVVADIVEKAAEKRSLPPTHVRAVALALGVPALVEALARAYDVLCNGDDAADAATEASVILLEALGGELVQGRAELEAENERAAQLRATLANLLLYARGNQPVLDLIHAALDKDERLAAGESSSPTPITEKGASDGAN